MKGNKFLFKNFILAVLCFIGIFAFTPVQARAETVDLESNKQYTIELTGGTTKTMTYTMPKEGYFYIKVIPQYYTYEGERKESDSWWLPIRMSVNFKKYEDYNVFKSQGSWNSKNYSFQPGEKVVIEAISTSPSEYIYYYDIEVVLVKEKNFEKEKNNSRKTANKITTGNTYRGLLMKDDEDWYTFKAPSTGYYKFYGVNTQLDSGNCDLVLYNTKYKELESLLLNHGDGYKAFKKIKLKKGQRVYLRAKSSFYWDIFYKIKVKKVK